MTWWSCYLWWWWYFITCVLGERTSISKNQLSLHKNVKWHDKWNLSGNSFNLSEAKTPGTKGNNTAAFSCQCSRCLSKRVKKEEMQIYRIFKQCFEIKNLLNFQCSSQSDSNHICFLVIFANSSLRYNCALGSAQRLFCPVLTFQRFEA